MLELRSARPMEHGVRTVTAATRPVGHDGPSTEHPVDRLERIDRRFVDAVDGALRPLTRWTGLDGGAFAIALGVLGAALLTATVAVLVRMEDPAALGPLALAVAALGALTAFDVWTILSQVRAARRAAADGLLVTDPHGVRRITWLALPLFVVLSLPLFATVGLALGATFLAAGYAAAGRCRPGGRRRRRTVWARGLAGSGA